MTALQNKLNATKSSDHSVNSLILHTAKIVSRILSRKIERKIEDVQGDQFGFRRGRGTEVEIGMPRIISEQTLDVDEELCACFIDWQRHLTV
jgi:hypothetical protein